MLREVHRDLKVRFDSADRELALWSDPRNAHQRRGTSQSEQVLNAKKAWAERTRLIKAIGQH